MGITNLNKFIGDYKVSVRLLENIGAIVIDGGNLLYRITERAKKSFNTTYPCETYNENTSVPYISVNEYINTVSSIAYDLVVNEIASYKGLCDEVIIVMDGFDKNETLGGYKDAEHDKRKCEVEKRLIKLMDPANILNASSSIDILNEVASETNSARPAKSTIDFINNNFLDCPSEDANAAMNYYGLIVAMEGMFHVRSNLRTYLMCTSNLGATVIDSGDKEADWVIMKVAGIRARQYEKSSVIITTDTDMLAFGYMLDNVYIKADNEIYNQVYISIKDTWLNMKNSFNLEQLNPYFMLGILLMLGCDFTSHKGAYTSCSLEEYVRYFATPTFIINEHPKSKYAKWLLEHQDMIAQPLVVSMCAYIDSITDNLGTSTSKVFWFTLNYLYGKENRDII